MYKCETERNVEIVKLKMRGWKEREIGNKYNISQPVVSCVIKSTLPKIIADEQIRERLKYLSPAGAIEEYKDLISERLEQLQTTRLESPR